MRLERWFLTRDERGNAATRLDGRHPDGSAWTMGNEVKPLIHGVTYFTDLLAVLGALDRGDLPCFAD